MEFKTAEEKLLHDYAALEDEADRLRDFAAEAWRELEAIGPDGVFCYERMREAARALGIGGLDG